MIIYNVTIKVDEAIDKIIHHFYEGVLNGFWDPERKYIDEGYKTIPFPFQEIQTPQFHFQLQWNAEQLLGYLGTWSAVQHYTDKIKLDPLDEIREELVASFDNNESKPVTFPILLRIGIIE